MLNLSGFQDLRVQVPLPLPSPVPRESLEILGRPSSPLLETTAASVSGWFQDFYAFFLRSKSQGKAGLLSALQLISAGSQTRTQFTHMDLAEGSCDQKTMGLFYSALITQHNGAHCGIFLRADTFDHIHPHCLL